MTVSIFTRSKVKDFDMFKKSIDSAAEWTKQQGVIATNVLRDLDDPNLVIVHQQLDDANKAKALVGLMNEDGFRKGPPVTEGGVILDTMEVWVAADA